MTTAQSLARIERVDPRSVWPNEAQDFTPWLASHIDELGEALGLDLELQSEEAPVGGFSLDILAREVGRDRPVIVENQLEETDHRHLGQLLTYAAGYDAGVVVWIAREFRDEHRAALDLLNRRTDDGIEFFGVVVEVWRIADSPPALNFRVTAAPNEWGKQVKQDARSRREGESSGKDEKYRKFFQPLLDVLREEHGFTNNVKARGQSGYGFAASSRCAQYYAHLQRQRTASVGVWIDGGDKSTNHYRFDSLEQNRDEIEAEVGELSWERRDQYQAPRIATSRGGSVDDDEDILQDIREWMVERLLALKKAFDPRLPDIDEPDGEQLVRRKTNWHTSPPGAGDCE